MGAVLRTSALPKLILCPSFIGSGGDAGPYAERGTMADVAFRLANEGKKIAFCESCAEYFEPESEVPVYLECKGANVQFEDPVEVLDERIEFLSLEHGIKNKPAAEGVKWAIEKMRTLAGDGVECITDESKLKVSVDGLDADSTADGNAPSVMVGFDLKTGKIANYMEQMAGYALGFMDEYFSDKWTMHLLFCDEKEVVTHKFTREEARRIVHGVRAKVLDPDRKQRPNPYCQWCALNADCQERREGAQRALEFAGGLNVREGLGEIKRSPARLAQFLDACDSLKPFEQVAENVARWQLEDGKPVPRWKLTRVFGIRHVTPESAIRHTKKVPEGEELTLEKIFKALGNLTPFQFKNIMKAINKPLPKRFSKQGRPSTYLMRDTKKLK